MTIAGPPNSDLATGTWLSIPKQAGLKQEKWVMQYVVVFEPTDNGFSAYVPDLPGCVAAAPTREEVEQLIREAIGYHIEMMREGGEAVSPPTVWTKLVEAAA